ncbi:PREDICTED: protein SENSITIVITY TO RED LIGHT REDUCED 1 [Nelumbo nucifera]|uniref:Protein SENSITIVITY TO RED LIGHT REDUCED 1 n=2 Tax=Nelumbo nucifera TaxID=4432 RepID=A0A1U7Z3W7_NELNU|nr:PREDICTED: protein SENSITIVITY TO RED LIGHT REDUCED 1 [Nelumbo nucifera]XP_010246870.1 PREDICTED: protein SENSITIVITY TO RED LIGHT REDUCED 1 [Nelumbo nucifera]DAD29391.1 TPA_asm: hypothetical protein HUJ06_030859 [Nelumbo nucifera]
MATTTKNVDPEELKEWTVVLPRRGKQRRGSLPKIRALEEQQQKPWVPTDLETDPERESKLMQKMQICIKKLEDSEFYCTFLNQILTPEILTYFSRILGSEIKMQMVVYGIGSIESYEPPRLQLSLAILIKRTLNWIGDIEVFDPVLSAIEVRVLEALGCCVLSVNEQGRREAIKPTMFFMPHCEAVLYDNLLKANWRPELLNRMVLFGNSFERYEHHVVEFKNSVVVDSAKHVLSIRRFTNEVPIKTVSDDLYRAFHDLSWHFFNLEAQVDLQLIAL